jgi:SAM-dependent methyltransferase
VTVLDQTENTPAAWSLRAVVAETPWEACGWTQRGQAQRLSKVVAALDPHAGDSLLDYGCGTGELTRYLPAEIGYVGFDPAEGMVIRAAQEHPEHHFQVWEPGHRFDLVAAVGPFNLRGHWSKQETWATLRRLWDLTGRALAVSLYAGDDQRCLIYDIDDVQSHLGGLSWDVVVERWRANDIVAVIRR